MKKKVILMAVVFSLLCLLLIYFKIQERKKLESLALSRNEESLVSISADKINRIRIVSTDGSIDLSRTSTISLESPLVHRANWILKDPPMAPAADDVVEDLLKKVTQLKAALAVADEQDAAEAARSASGAKNPLGLTPPDLVLILDAEGSSEVISFGSKSNISGRRYVQKEGVSDLYLMELDFPRYYVSVREKIKSREVLKIKPEHVVGLDVLEGDRFFRLFSFDCSSSVDSWRLKSGGDNPAKAEGSFLLRKLQELSLLKVRRVFEDASSMFQYTGLETPFLVISMSFDMRPARAAGCMPGTPVVGVGSDGTSKELLLQFGKGLGFESRKGIEADKAVTGEDAENLSSLVPSQSYYLKIGGETRIYEVERSFVADWLQGGDHFRSRNPYTDFRLDDMKEFEVIAPDESCTVLATGERISVIKSMIKESIKDLAGIHVDAIVNEPELSLYKEVPGKSISLKTQEGVYALKERAHIPVIQIDSGEQPVASVAPVTRPASVIEISRPAENSYFGVVNAENMVTVDKLIAGICQQGAASEKPSGEASGVATGN